MDDIGSRYIKEAFLPAIFGFGMGVLFTWLMYAPPDQTDWQAKYLTETQALAVQTERVMFYERLLEKVFDRVPATTYSTPVTVTAYSAREEETNSEPWRTADLSPSRVGMLAVSRDILSELGVNYGDTVILEGLGVYRVHDTMNKRFTRRVDILMAHHKAAKIFGKQKAMLTWVRGGK